MTWAFHRPAKVIKNERGRGEHCFNIWMASIQMINLKLVYGICQKNKIGATFYEEYEPLVMRRQRYPLYVTVMISGYAWPYSLFSTIRLFFIMPSHWLIFN